MTSKVKRHYLRKRNSESGSGGEAVETKRNGVQFNLCAGSDAGDEDSNRSETNLEDVFDKLRSSPMKQTVHMKPLSFWSKKLRDLESEETKKKVTKVGLYEFSASEDSSFVPGKKKTKPKRQYTVRKNKKKTPVEFPITAKKTRKIKGQSTEDNQNKAKRKPKKPLEKSGKKELLRKGVNTETLEFIAGEDKENIRIPQIRSTVDMSKILTSTPAPNRAKRFMNESGFSHLSPIEKKCDVNDGKYGEEFESPVKRVKVRTNRIPKLKEVKEPENKCTRVLRSRKIPVSQ